MLRWPSDEVHEYLTEVAAIAKSVSQPGSISRGAYWTYEPIPQSDYMLARLHREAFLRNPAPALVINVRSGEPEFVILGATIASDPRGRFVVGIEENDAGFTLNILDLRLRQSRSLSKTESTAPGTSLQFVGPSLIAIRGPEDSPILNLESQQWLGSAPLYQEVHAVVDDRYVYAVGGHRVFEIDLYEKRNREAFDSNGGIERVIPVAQGTIVVTDIVGVGTKKVLGLHLLDTAGARRESTKYLVAFKNLPPRVFQWGTDLVIYHFEQHTATLLHVAAGGIQEVERFTDVKSLAAVVTARGTSLVVVGENALTVLNADGLISRASLTCVFASLAYDGKSLVLDSIIRAPSSLQWQYSVYSIEGNTINKVGDLALRHSWRYGRIARSLSGDFAVFYNDWFPDRLSGVALPSMRQQTWQMTRSLRGGDGQPVIDASDNAEIAVLKPSRQVRVFHTSGAVVDTPELDERTLEATADRPIGAPHKGVREP